MIDLKLFQNDYENSAKLLSLKKVAKEDIEQLYNLILERNKLVAERDNLRAKLNNISDDIKTGSSILKFEEFTKLKEEASKIKVEVQKADDASAKVETELNDLHLRIPNFPHKDAPIGREETDNVILRYEGYNESDYEGNFKTHWEIGEELGILDIEAASKISGSMFALFRKDGAKLIRSLIQLGLDINGDEYEEVLPPHFVSSKTFTGTGHLPKFADDAYALKQDDLWAIPTGEVPLTGMGRDVIFKYSDLPKKYMAPTVCFRREAGSSGKDTRGLQRLHEFHKLELLKYVTKENVQSEFELMLANAEKILQLLKLPYRVVNLCTGDLTFSGALIYDLEVYSKGLKKWLEVSSVGIFTDFQARRSNIRYRKEDKKMEFVNLINGSAIATPRVWAAIIENYQLPDGSVMIPHALQKYFGKTEIKK